MWLEKIEQSSITNELRTKSIAEYKGDTGDIRVLNNEDAGNILVSNDEVLFCQKDWDIYAEMLAHTPLCTHPNPEDILLVGYDSNIIKQVLRHKDVKKIIVVEVDKNISLAINEHFLELELNDKIQIVSKQEFLKGSSLYDVILFNDTKLKEFNIFKQLKKDGIFICKSNGWWDMDLQKDTFKVLGDYFKIIMPCYFNMYVSHTKSFVFASNKFHPTADTILDKSDLLDGLHYYNGDTHKACFSLPTNIDKEYKDFIKK